METISIHLIMNDNIMNGKLQTQYLYDLGKMLSFTRLFCSHCRLGDVGGQKTLRSYWRNYFEKTDALVWVVDSTDRLRIEDCKAELRGLLLEEVSRDTLISTGL